MDICTDFEVGIINASSAIFPDSQICCCYFHLKKNLYRHIQSLGLQTPYNDPNNREVKIFVHMTAALAFVPPEDVMVTFQRVKRVAPACLHDFMEYFENTYT